MRAAIIVGVLIGVFGIIALALILWNRKRRRGAKKGYQTNSLPTASSSTSLGQPTKDSQLETGVIHEPLPVYQREI
jgi:hypothetical protein